MMFAARWGGSRLGSFSCSSTATARIGNWARTRTAGQPGGGRHFCSNKHKNRADALNEKHLKVAYLTGALAVAVFGISYASVPLYKVFCSMTGFGGTTQRVDEEKATTVKPVSGWSTASEQS
jgi:hypothetical protein